MGTSGGSLGQDGARLFAPSGVAVIGASESHGKVGRLLMENLTRSFDGEIYPVHPRARRILGLDVHSDVRQLEGRADLAVIATRAETTAQVLEDCAVAGVAVAVVVSGGFSETGAEGAAREARVRDIARNAGMRLVGPNCFGVIDTGSGLNASIAPGFPSPGGVSLVTQSGAYAMAAVTRAREGLLGTRRILSLGNKADVDEIDALSWLDADPETEVIAMLLESTSRGVDLVEAVRNASKPIVVMKSGRSGAGQRAAASHTAALADDARTVRAAMRQAGAHWVEDGLGLLDTAAALDRQPPAKGRRVGIIGNSGGVGVELADLLEAQGLEVPRLSDTVRARIASWLPSPGSADNPIDVTTDWARFSEAYGQTLRLLLAGDEVDLIVVVLVHRAAVDQVLGERLLAEIRASQASGRTVPVHVCWVAPRSADPYRVRLTSAGLPCHPWPLRTARAVAASLSPTTQRPRQRVVPSTAPETDDGRSWVETAALFDELAHAGLPIARCRECDSSETAARQAADFGFPVVLKAIRAGLLHRSRADAVRVGLRTRAAVVAAFDEFATRLGPGPVLVQEQAPPGVELVIGARRDPSFGLVQAVGLGGTSVEIVDDVSLRLAPVSREEAIEMLEQLQHQEALNHPIGSPPVDRAAVAQLIARVSSWLCARGDVAELDINPVVVRGDSLTIVDARLRVDSKPT